jgi:hypothetical protein
MHNFKPLPPKKRRFFSHFRLKNARFSATSAQKRHVFQPLTPEKCTFFSHFHLKNARILGVSVCDFCFFPARSQFFPTHGQKLKLPFNS